MNKKGFTLTELMIVLIVISGLMYLVIPNISNTKNSLDHKTCDAYIELVNTQIQAYRVDHGVYPVDLQTLKDADYIKDTSCPDGTPIEYQSNVASVPQVTTSSEVTPSS